MVQFTPQERYAAQVMARQDLYFFTRWMFLHRRGFKWVANWHHKVICDALMRVFRGECTRLIINVPPRYSKTELAVVNFIAWAMGNVPDAEFIYTTYSGTFAASYSGDTRDLVAHEAYAGIFPDVHLATDAKSAWRTTAGGALYAVGEGGSITGMGAGKMRDSFGGAIILDDAHKADEARSDTVREGVIEWYQNTLQSRVNSPSTPIIFIMQRLHERDISGWALAGGTGEKWEHICLPALAEQDDEYRKAGEALWPAKHTAEKLAEMRTAMPYTFAGQYQQSPSSPEGNIFKPDNIRIVDALPVDGVTWLTGWDFAASVPRIGKDPDYTVGFKLGRDREGRYLVGDVTRMRGSPDEVETCLLNTTRRHGVRCRVSLPQDPGQAGKSQVLGFTKLLSGYRVESSPESGDKVTRAEAFAAQVNVGNVSMLKADWNDALIDEMRAFPNGAHDDQIDAGSRAFNELAVKGSGLHVSDELLKRLGAR